MKGYIMENILTVNGADSNIAKLRTNVGKSEKATQGTKREYAIALNALFADFDWFDVKHTDVSENAKLVHAEKQALFEVIRKYCPDHKNVSQPWKMVREYGKEERYGKEEKPESEEKDENEKREAKSPMLRNMDDLLALYKFNARQDSLPEKIRQAQVHIASALAALGVDISLIK